MSILCFQHHKDTKIVDHQVDYLFNFSELMQEQLTPTFHKGLTIKAFPCTSVPTTSTEVPLGRSFSECSQLEIA